MKTVWKVLSALVILALTAIAALLIYVKTFLPNVGPPPELTVEATPERLERGEYLFHYVAACADCHSHRKDDLFGHPLDTETVGMGGHHWDDIPIGDIHAPNITPAAVGDWTDGELYRAITAGVNRDGKALFPLMPWPNYGQMPDEDIYSIIAYMRTLEPIENDVPRTTLDFPLSLIINTMPKKGEPMSPPDRSDKVAYGKYLVTLASCGDCHTPMDDKGAGIEGMYLAGGNPFKQPTGGYAISLNITPDPETGIGKMDEEQFVRLFKQYTDSSYVPRTIAQNDFNTEMPWVYYAQMEEEDLRAIFAYLQTVPPIKNEVGDRFVLQLAER